MSDDALLKELTEMKKTLAGIARDGDPRPKPKTNVVSINDPWGLNEPHDEYKQGLLESFMRVWPHFRRIEAELIERDVLDQPIELTWEERNHIPL